jgi:hypothetical protein
VSEKIMAIAKDLQKKEKIPKTKFKEKKGNRPTFLLQTLEGKEMLHGNEKDISFKS